MRPSRLLLAMVGVVVALHLSGCDRSGADTLASAKARMAKNDDASVEIDLKNYLQRHPESGEARYLLALQLHKRGDGHAALIELQRALDLKYPDTLVLPAIARSLLAQGKFKQVVDEFGKTELSDALAQAELQGLVAQALYYDGDAQAAIELINKAAAAAPTLEQVQLTKASFLAQTGNSAQSLAVLQALIASKPDSHLAWTMKGQVEGINPATAQAAQQSLRKAAELKPAEIAPRAGLITLALQKGDLEAARQEMAALKKIAPKELTTQFYEAAVASSEGRHADAQSLYQAVLRVLPLHPMVLVAAAENELKLNATAQAESLTAKALAQSPDNLRARELQAQVYLRQGQPAKAIASLSSLIDSPRATPQILALAAQAQLVHGNPAAANQLYDRIARLQPTDPQLRTVVAIAALGRTPDDRVFSELRAIAAVDAGTTADMVLVSTLVRRGQADEALKALDAVERKRPQDPNQQILRGQILAGKGDMAGSRRAFEEALVRSPGHVKAVLALASLDLRDEKPDAARERLKALVKQQPKNSTAMLALAELLRNDASQAAQRKKLLETAVQSEPSDPDARSALVAFHWESGDRNAALVAAHAATAALPESIEMLDLLAWCQMRVGEASQALSAYGKMMVLAPRNPRGHLGATQVHLHNGDLDKARRSIERGLQAQPGNLEILSLSVVLQLRMGQPEQARTLARDLQRDRPADAIGWILEGEVDASQQQWAKAASAYRKALDLSPPPDLLPKYLHALKLAGKPAEAKAFADARHKTNPGDIGLLFYLADLAQRAGNLKEARLFYEDLLRRKGDHYLALNNLANLHLAQQQPGALPLARRAAMLAPREPAVLATLAQALASDGSVEEAVTTQKLAVQLAPQLPELRLTLARMLVRKGDKAAAVQELARLASLGPRYAEQAEVARLVSEVGGTLPAR